ncbi:MULTISPECIES: ribonuclease Z [Halomicrobium]|uniref:Ribonuclease Z n=2 Tax=Halomicrobium mukohataei TaxID=57705 RepID=C7P1I6_HALMD|nr:MULTISPECIES: ribonuclease Z [Halomicrobium]ACV47194.1 ribonuclease Z [Halomicrobium mukohataei DSM 12286]QCD65670.1 ribonuclease Z [Halomicrobium mukohataei]QFR20476.1 ribonuclease Z [Halomicrobium sp. ZPS1]
MRVTFLGTSGAVPTTERNPSALFVNRDGDKLLFDCGEGTQRQMMRFGTGFAVDHVFVTHTHGDHVLGIPGLLQTFDFNDREEPLAIHAPAGTRGTIEDLVSVTGDTPSFPVRITQVSAGDTVLDGDGYEVRAIRTQHRCQSVGYAVVEDDRKGRFDREKAEEELGIEPGPKYSKLHRGEPVEHEGRTIQPEAVVGPDRPGRTLVYTGDTRPTDSVVEASEDADLLVHDATFADDWAERARKTAHATGREAAEVAQEAGAKRLALTHISTRYGGNPTPILSDAREAFDGEVFVPDDGRRIDVPFPDE